MAAPLPPAPAPTAPHVGREAANVLRVLREAVASSVSSEKQVTVLFSGGVDSSLVAALVPQDVSGRLVTVGLPGTPDLAAARTAASLLGLPWRGVELEPKEIEAMGVRLRDLGTLTNRKGTDSIRLSLALALAHADPGLSLVGQGADELFLGYAHFRGLSQAGALRRRDEDLDRLLGEEWPVTERIGRTLGRRVGAPFLDPRVVAMARTIPVPALLGDGGSKPLLRAAARELGLPAEIADRAKRAIQYGSGIERWLRRSSPSPPLGR